MLEVGDAGATNRRQFLAGASGALATGLLSPNDLKSDVAIIRRALALHPGLYRYATPVDVEGRLQTLEAAFMAAPSAAARYLSLSRFLATIRCGHSYCNFYNQREALAADLFDRKTRLPFHFAWLGGRMTVTADPSVVGVSPGSEIVAINRRPARDLLPKLLPYARADGHNDGKRVSLLGVAGADSIEFFDVFHGLTEGVPPGGVFDVALRSPAGDVRRRELPAFGLAERRAQMRRHKRAGDDAAWDWTMRPDGVAVLTMPTWALYDSKWDWRAWLHERLDSLDGARGLVLDLRENEGGLDCGDEILARLTPRPIALAQDQRRVRFQRTPADLDHYLDTWDNSFRTLGLEATPLSDGFYRLAQERSDETLLPRGRRLLLKVAALIGPANSSATARFAQKARMSGLVRLFGETTGGNQRGINGGAFFFVRLPASGIEFDLPLIGYFPPGTPPDAGVPPDVVVPRTVADLASAHDTTLEIAARWTANQQPA